MYTNFLRGRGDPARVFGVIPRVSGQAGCLHCARDVLLADRYLSDGDRWIDLATGCDVCVSIDPAGRRSAQLAWAEQCAMQSVLRHASINPLIDYGVADPAHTFEVYEVQPALALSDRAASLFVAHASKFLSAHGVVVTAARAGAVFRTMALTSDRRGVPLGFVIQPRRVLGVLEELLDEPPQHGRVVIVAGPPGSGLRTLRRSVAHLARIRGYLVISPAALARVREVETWAAARHVCVLASDATRAARLDAHVRAVSPHRTHVAIAFVRCSDPPPGALSIDPLGVTTMSSMLYVDPDAGPDTNSLFRAARRADGWPGRFLDALGQPSDLGGASVVHERSAVYETAPAVAAAPGRRLQRVLDRAIPRAQELAARGRLPAARRTLERAARVHRGRGQHVEADACLSTIVSLDAGANAPARGASEDHTSSFLRIAHASADDRTAIDAVLSELRRISDASVVALFVPDQRVLALAGRSWGETGRVVLQALAGVPVGPAESGEPPQAAHPIVLAGDVVGAVAMRWAAGAHTNDSMVLSMISACSLALATHVRALLDAERVHDVPSAAAWGDLVGESEAARMLRDAVARAARAPFAVLIEGESGSGKELVARAIHRLSVRRERKLCAVNCAALTEDLLEAELFGHARGAFTGAAVDRAGLFEEADGGTLFLDEVGELSARAQAKLLRVLQDGEVRRVGENFSRRVDVRIVAATNRNLVDEVTAGRFRADLRFRLDVVRITVPPLRERAADIAILAAHFWRDAAARVGTHATLGPDAISALTRYDWPGNVRELQNAIAWIAVHAPRRGRVSAALLPAQIAASAPLSTGSFEAAREEFERRYVRAALAQAGGQRGRAAASLGLTRQGLAKMMKRLGIDN